MALHRESQVTAARWVGGALLVGLLFTVEAVLSLATPASASVAVCQDGVLHANGGAPEIHDLVVDRPCTLQADSGLLSGTWKYGVVNIIEGGSLHVPSNLHVDFWAQSILIQNGGSFTVGNIDPATKHIIPLGGLLGTRLTIHLYGAEQSPRDHGKGVPCKKKVGMDRFEDDPQCGIPDSVWNSNKMSENPTSCVKKDLSDSGVNDCFYKYDTMPFDDGDKNSYFGYKVLGVSYGGTLQLYGFEGALYPDSAVDPQNSGTSWLRLNNCNDRRNRADFHCSVEGGVLEPGATTLLLDTSKLPFASLSWRPGDLVVITSTDYLSSHSEVRQIAEVSPPHSTVNLSRGLAFPHNASVYDLTEKIPQGKGLPDLESVDTRAAVALLTHSIRIVSGGANFGQDLPPANDKSTDRFFGGHVVIRQGFKKVQIQGVEFYQLGQGGKIGHYPLHFHMARKVPNDTFVKDCSVWDSMTRWITVHATQGLLLARNVGYRSIGHGYYLEDGTETDNKLYANIGISALAAVEDAANERKVPGLLAYNGPRVDDDGKDIPNDVAPPVPYKTDINNPTLFWSMNGWNDFEYNMAVGAETCGLCYWMVPGNNSGGSKMMYWTGYASEQKDLDHDGNTPIQKFIGNTCSTAMTSFSSIADISPCNGTFTGNSRLAPIPNALVPKPFGNLNKEGFYPVVHGGVRKGTFCPGKLDVDDCSRVNTCSDSADSIGKCAVTTVDKYTTSFNFPETNFAAIWLRPQWNLLINSAVTDVLNGGLSFVTGGGYTRSDTPRGLWNLARKDVFIGNTQPYAANPYASNGGPVNPNTGLTCRNGEVDINYCIPQDGSGHDQGPIFQRSNFAMNQRFFSLYDGPSFEDSNAYLDITTTKLNDCDLSPGNGDVKRCRHSQWMQAPTLGVPGVFQAENKPPGGCYLPNAAIAWKQPNGFYYPPAFHSTNLFFDKVDIRHYVIEPLFKPRSLDPDIPASKARYCNVEDSMWNGFTDVDRQTELNDDDGSLTGLINTISVNQDPFFNAPTEDVECRSDVAANTAGTAKTSPYDYVTTVLYPEECGTERMENGHIVEWQACDAKEVVDGKWSKACTNEQCFGVPLYREYLIPGENKSAPPSIRMSGQAIGQRSTLTANNGRYFIDTTNSAVTQKKDPRVSNLSVFEKNKTYHVFLLFAKDTTSETYDIFVGKDADKATVLASVQSERTKIPGAKIKFTDKITWPDVWKKDYNDGILTVTMNMNFATFKMDYNDSISGRCQPVSMCEWKNSQCQCNASSQSYLPDDCKNNLTGICSWAVKDIDYPDKGAYGFSFTLPDKFAYTTTPPPNVACFTKAKNPEWDVSFKAAKGDVAGDCEYKKPPPSPEFCMSP